MSEILHEELFANIPLTGGCLRNELQQHIEHMQQQIGKAALSDPNISVVIRTRNNNGPYGFLKHLLNDIDRNKAVYSGEVQVIVVDTESTDGTQNVAAQHGAEIISIAQKDFNYPLALNQGFRAAKYPYVLSLVGHSLLAHNRVFHVATAHFTRPDVAGVSGLDLPSANASRAERLGAAITHPGRMRKQPTVITAAALGVLAANKSFISKAAWKAAGGFDEAYGAGGEDQALAATLIDQEWTIIEDSTLAVHHSHNLDLIGYARQVNYWQSISKGPQPFDRERLLEFRSDLH